MENFEEKPATEPAPATAAEEPPLTAQGLIEKHQQWVYPLAFRICQDPVLAEEATVRALAESFIGMRRSPQKKDFRKAAAIHLLEILKNHPAKKRRKNSLSFDEELNLRTGGMPRERKVLLGAVIAGLKHLSFEERSLVLLRDQAHFSCDTIGEILRDPPNQIRQRLAAVRAKLKSVITESFKESLRR